MRGRARALILLATVETPAMRHRCLCCAPLVPVWIAACGGGGSGPTATPPPGPQPSAGVTAYDHFLGEADVPGGTLFVEALTTKDGQARIHVSSFLWDRTAFEGGAGPSGDLVRPTQSMQFVGNVTFSGLRATGDGVILGQNCTSSPPGRFCDAPAEASLNYDVNGEGTAEGDLRVTTPSGVEDWALHLNAWSDTYHSRATDVSGVFRDELAPFSAANDVLVDLDHGQLSFHSNAAGCTGQGTFMPHLNGQYGVYDVVLQLTACDPPYALLDGELQGLAVFTQSGKWDYDDGWLVMLLAAPDGAPPRAALTMRAHVQ